MKLNHLLFLALLCISFMPVLGQQTRTIYFRNGSINPPANIQPSYIDSFNALTQGRKFAIIQFNHIPTEADRKILSANRMELLDYIPDNAYSVNISGDVSYHALLETGALSIFIPSPKNKMDDFFSKGIIPAWAVKSFGTVDALISFPSTINFSEVLAELRTRKVEVLSITRQAYRIISVRIRQNMLEEIAALPFIEYLQVAPPADQPLNSNSEYGSRANVLQTSIANGGFGLMGEGVVIGIGDNADIQTHGDFAGRLINRSPYHAAGHGHHVAGTAAGAGNLYELYKGFAPKATIIKQGFSGILDNAGTYVQDYGMVITNNSYGNVNECEYHGIYDLYSRLADQMAFDYPYLSNVFAAGNSGGNTCAPFAPGFHTVMGSFQSAKNVISVGATNDSAVLAFFSSRGPVKDGRIKPEITAMGQSVISTWPTNTFSFNNGTSMASPAVAGGMALLYQRYRQLNGGANPKNGLVKAIVANGGSDKGNTGPDYGYGFGWMNLLRSVEMIENNSYMIGTATQGNVYNHTITVPANTARLKVMLYWNDPAASMFAQKTLVNDLDLQVIHNSQTHLPFILDSSNAGSGNAALTGADHINNIEQIVINQPAAGTYTLRVLSTAINQNPSQEFFLVYDAVPVQLKIVNPMSGMPLLPLIQTKINWEAHGFSTGTVNIDLSTDDGNSWSSIATGVDINRPGFSWWPPDIATDKGRIRITKTGTGETTVSGAFTILARTSISMDPIQCAGYMNINWTAIPGATSYEVMRVIGDEMKTIATTTSLNHVISGLHKDSTYYVAVRGVVNSSPGFRSFAVAYKPGSGSCAGSISDNDLFLESFNNLGNARRFTSWEPDNTSLVSMHIKNLDDAPVHSFEARYSFNGGPWISETVNVTILPGGFYNHVFATTINRFPVGAYTITGVVNNVNADPVKVNDTVRLEFTTLANDALNLSSPFVDDIETALPGEYYHGIMGLKGLSRYDFASSSLFGRLRTFINSGIASSGQKALSLDVNRSVAGTSNLMTGTYNISNYNIAANDLRLDFKYLNHGENSDTVNKVWIRGDDTKPWIEVYDLLLNEAAAGTYKKTESIELSDLLSSAAQQFTSSFQVRWGQKGNYSATDKSHAAGYSIDDIRIYEVFNDVQARSIDAPGESGCGLSAATTIQVSVKNSSNNVLNNIPVKYSINNGNWITETIASIPANTTIQYNFLTKADLSALGLYSIRVLTDLNSDSFRDNDTITKEVRHLPLVNSFPYLQNFEQSDGHWYAGGERSSWEYGTPSSYKINKAASGTKAWKTNLFGTYHSEELSYLYSPCFNTSGMSAPSLSFSVAMDIEDCGNIECDAAWVEYSLDGNTWLKLGSSGSGTNWYNKPAHEFWSVGNYIRWHVATAALPASSNLRLRFVFKSDQGVEKDGISIDDIHVYDLANGIYDGTTTTAAITNSVSGTGWVNFIKDGKLIASIQPKNQNLGTTAVKAFINTDSVRNIYGQYYHDRNITIQPAVNAPGDSVRIRFYFLDAETDSLLFATGCAGCHKPSSAYELGVSKYSDPVLSFENGNIADNQQGLWSFIPRTDVTIVPFDKGYYAEFSVKDFSEFWLSSGGFENVLPLPVKLLKFTAEKVLPEDVLLKWQVAAEENIDRYEIELARTQELMVAGNYEKIGEVMSPGNTSTTRNYDFTDTEAGKMGVRYYRLKIINQNTSFKYSPVRSVIFNEAVLWTVYPNPSNGIFSLMYQLNQGDRINARIYDAQGRLVKQQQEQASGLAQKASFDLGMMASGIYLLRIDAGGKTYSFKLHKQ